jgi:hypothetical protein
MKRSIISFILLFLKRVNCLKYAFRWGFCLFLLPAMMPVLAQHAHVSKVERVESQPLIAQVKRLVEAMDYLGVPISSADKQALENAFNATDGKQTSTRIQAILDKYCLLDVHINPESRVKVAKGPAKAELSEQGWRSFLVKVSNEAGVTAQLKAESPNALPVSSRGTKGFSMDPLPKQTILNSMWLTAGST